MVVDIIAASHHMLHHITSHYSYIAQVDGVDVVVDHQAGKVDCTDPGLQVCNLILRFRLIFP